MTRLNQLPTNQKLHVIDMVNQLIEETDATIKELEQMTERRQTRIKFLKDFLKGNHTIEQLDAMLKADNKLG